MTFIAPNPLESLTPLQLLHISELIAQVRLGEAAGPAPALIAACFPISDGGTSRMQRKLSLKETFSLSWGDPPIIIQSPLSLSLTNYVSSVFGHDLKSRNAATGHV